MLPYTKIEEILAYRFEKPEWLLQALTHRSALNEGSDSKNSYERLEFLGDSLLNFFVTESLFQDNADADEGVLSRQRAALVSKEACAFYFEKLGLIEMILLAKGDHNLLTRSKGSIGADVYEALIGAILMDGGMSAARQFFERSAVVYFDTVRSHTKKDFKALLQDFTLRVHRVLPEYVVLFEEGPGHQKSFLVAVSVEGREAGRGRGGTKKEAEQAAAMEAVLYHGWRDEQTKTRL